MRIETSTVAMSVEHQSSVQRTIVHRQGGAVDPVSLQVLIPVQNPQELEPSADFTGPLQGDNSERSIEEWVQAGAALDARMRLNKLVLEGFLGRHLELTKRNALASQSAGSQSTAAVANSVSSLSVADNSANNSVPAEGGLADTIDVSQFLLQLEEKERTHVTLSANITMLDGRQINVNIAQEMSRHLKIEREAVEADIARFMDPLVINFSGPVRLDNTRVNFDLDGDGESEGIARFASDSAYLALDKNGDGRINNGGELFGVASNNGFEDLRAYDLDGNGYIDEADPIFSQLSLYRPGFEGNISIRSAGIEAFSLDYIESPFSLKSSAGEDLGRVRSTGFYLTNTGSGSLQQIDLAV